jgi:glutamate racemase
MTTPQPIALFDSGIGGLTVLQALTQQMPHESYVYLGDTARLPYGTKSPDTVRKYALGIVQHLLTYQPKALVIACNTASTHALEAVQNFVATQGLSIPVIGMIDPAVQAACRQSQNQHILVMGTSGTILSGAYERALRLLNPSVKISSVACQMLVALAEEGWTDTDIARAALQTYLDPILENESSKPDTLILGCTHFPLFASMIRSLYGSEIHLINTGQEAAHRVQTKIKRASGHKETMHFLVTDDADRFCLNAQKFFSDRIHKDQVSVVDL